MPTKWYEQNHKNEGIRYADTPIPIAAARDEREDRPMCPYCWCYTVIKEEFNDRRTRTTCDRIFNIKQSDKGVETGIIVENDNMDDNAETLVSTAVPDPDQAYLNKDNIEPKGAFKVLQYRGLKITSYTETDSSGRPLKRNRWS